MIQLYYAEKESVNRFKILFTFLFLITLLNSNRASSSPNLITFQSRIIKPDGTALEASAVYFRITLTDSIGTCVIFQEDFSSLNMSGSKGLINLTLGNGTKVFPVGPMTLTEVFNNFNSPTFNCQSGGNVNASTTDRRKLIMQFNDGNGWQTVPTMDINSNPFALQAVSAHRLGDFPAADYVRTATFPTCVGGEALNFNGASFTCVAVSSGVANGGNTGLMTIGTNDGSALNFETNNITRMTVDTTGNVGIGTAVIPAATLHTVSAGAKTSSSTGNLFENTATSGTGSINKVGLNVQSTGVWNGASSVNTGLNVNVSGGTTNYAAIFQGGNVGIGTTSPLGRLHVDAGGYNALYVGDSGGNAFAGAGYMAKFYGAAGGGSQIAIGVREAATGAEALLSTINTGGAGTGVVGTVSNSPLSVRTNNTARMTLDAAGNVGIGTTIPTAKLEVAGDVKIGNSAAACNASTKGSIRYNDVSSVLEFCNGSSWNLVQAAACTDATPTSFTFSDQSNQTTLTVVTSDIVQISGLNCSVPVTVSGAGSPQFQICSDVACGTVVQGWTSSPSSIVSGQYIQMRQTSDAAGGAATFATIIVGGTASIWTISTAGGDCVGTTPPVGTVCADGTIYAGLSPDTSAKMFTTRCDYGQTWNGSACTGVGLAQNWNNGTTNWTATGFTNANTGKANSAGISILADAGSVHAAARVCEDLNQEGHTDWYLPASNEVGVLYAGKNAIRNFSVSGSGYWSSTEIDPTYAYYRRFSDGLVDTRSKTLSYYVRCVRR